MIARSVAAAGLLGVFFAVAAHSEVLDSQANGFTVRQSASIAAPVGKVWDAVGRIGAWWDPEHSYSHDARNLTIKLEPGGAWREAQPGGGVIHMVVVNVQPQRMIRTEGALGPLQADGATGHLTWMFAQTAGATTVTQTYDVGGHAPGGLDKLAGPVDAVLGQQLARLKRYVETGDPK